MPGRTPRTHTHRTPTENTRTESTQVTHTDRQLRQIQSPTQDPASNAAPTQSSGHSAQYRDRQKQHIPRLAETRVSRPKSSKSSKNHRFYKLFATQKWFRIGKRNAWGVLSIHKCKNATKSVGFLTFWRPQTSKTHKKHSFFSMLTPTSVKNG